jgi:hypothetical protein
MHKTQKSGIAGRRKSLPGPHLGLQKPSSAAMS